MNILSPELQTTQDDFIEALSSGIDAAEKMVDGLAVEAVALEVYTDEFARYERENVDISEIADQGTLDYLWADTLIKFQEDMSQQHDSAASRYSFALWMLMNTKTRSSE